MGTKEENYKQALKDAEDEPLENLEAADRLLGSITSAPSVATPFRGQEARRFNALSKEEQDEWANNLLLDKLFNGIYPPFPEDDSPMPAVMIFPDFCKNPEDTRNLLDALPNTFMLSLTKKGRHHYQAKIELYDKEELIGSSLLCQADSAFRAIAHAVALLLAGG